MDLEITARLEEDDNDLEQIIAVGKNGNGKKYDIQFEVMTDEKGTEVWEQVEFEHYIPYNPVKLDKVSLDKDTAIRSCKGTLLGFKSDGKFSMKSAPGFETES